MKAKSSLHTQLENSRKELLDLSSRNRLINTSRNTARSSRLEIVNAFSEEVFRYLVIGNKAMNFIPVPDKAEEESDKAEADGIQPEDENCDVDGVAAPQKDDEKVTVKPPKDNELQTCLSSDRLQKTLLKFYYDARTYEEEQGVNILYLALGFLKWYEDQNSDKERYAPLLLVPVALDRSSATSKFKIRYTDDEINTNLSLQSRLKNDFGIKLPDVPEGELSPTAYYDDVTSAIQGQLRWEVLPNDIVLWFFSFSKFLMYRDLDPNNWPPSKRLDENPIITGLLGNGFASDPPLFSENDKIDSAIHPLDMVHVLDADSSQTIAIEEVKRGRNLVIQGPPGTGKSQTIANIIAIAVKTGKTVLFMAEKMAALEVVKRRLNNIGLGDMCLELHSKKANNKTVLQDLEHTLQLGQPHVEDVKDHCEKLHLCMQRLNRYIQIIHTPLDPSGVTIYQAIGKLITLRASGTKLYEFKLENPLQWSNDAFRERLNLLRDIVEHTAEIGIPQNHIWQGVETEVILPSDIDRLIKKIPQIIAQLNRVVSAGNLLAQRFAISAPDNMLAISQAVRLAKCLETMPKIDLPSLGSSVWAKKRQEIDYILEIGNRFKQCRSQLSGIIREEGWNTNVVSARDNLSLYGHSWFRIFYKAYREAQVKFRDILVSQPPQELQQQLAILDWLIQGQKARDIIESADANELGQQAFGNFWQGISSDWVALAAITKWESDCRAANIDPNFRQIYAALDFIPEVKPLLAQIEQEADLVLKELQWLKALLVLNMECAFGSSTWKAMPFNVLISRLQQWQAEPESLSRWIAYRIRHVKMKSKGMRELATEIYTGRISPSEAVNCFEMAFFEELVRYGFQKYPELATFNGVSYEQVIESFKKLDKERIALACQEVAYVHYASIPKSNSDIGELGLVRREIEKKRRHLPIRKLLSQAGQAVQAIKPVFMMSPISVAQFLEPGVTNFDILLLDEASQVQPVDALGAIARTKQFVVVGDDKQLPPTRFFNKMLGEDCLEDKESSELQTGDIESILGLCCSQGVTQRMLRWHYRSRHHSLIAVSNHEFYDDRLYVVPSPGKPSKGQGLEFHYVQSGIYDRGGSSTNCPEAKLVANAIMEHAREFSDKSLGVGTFSISQRDAILDELESLRHDDPSLEQFFITAKPEPFFVKNLENIQGDERDVIFISIGYGKDNTGSMAMNFGPLSNDGGERRLNVLITRARERCAVFSSIHGDDIDLKRTQSRGAKALKTFLKYAETERLETELAADHNYESEFERQVAEALKAYGYSIAPQVGVAGFYIDLAVIDPDSPGRYLLGIECDGANYHRSQSARDRDRLRQTVLEDRGWIIHRIWSIDWFYRPEEALRKTLAAINAAKVEWASRTDNANTRHANPIHEHVEITRHDCDSIDNDVCLSQPYVVASFSPKTSEEIHKLSASELARIIARIIEIEGPVHREEIARRVTQLWGQERVGQRIRNAVDKALLWATRRTEISHEGEFYSLRSPTEVMVRNRREVNSSTLRRHDMIPPAEIRKAVSTIVEMNLGVPQNATISKTAQALGFKSTSPQLRQVIENEIEDMLNKKLLEERNGKLYSHPE